MLSGKQCKAARTGLGWSRDDLASKSGVGKRTIIDFENEARQPINATKLALKQTLEKGGVSFGYDQISLPVEADQPMSDGEQRKYDQALEDAKYILDVDFPDGIKNADPRKVGAVLARWMFKERGNYLTQIALVMYVYGFEMSVDNLAYFARSHENKFLQEYENVSSYFSL